MSACSIVIATQARWLKPKDRGGRAPDIALKDVTLVRPVVFPEKILCIGVNYGNRHAEYKDGTASRRNIRACSSARPARSSARASRW